MDVLAVGPTDFAFQHLLSRKYPMDLNNDFLLYSGQGARMEDPDTRKRTFIFWPSANPVHPDALVDAYFHYTGNEDEVKCHSCHMTHKGWTGSDDPLEVHLRMSPNCMLARGRALAYESAGHDYNGATSAGPHISAKLEKMKRNNETNPHSTHHSNTGQTDSSTHEAPTSNVIASRLPPRIPTDSPNVNLQQLAHEEARLQTFVGNWPRDNPVAPQNLAKAGLFYKGPGDRVQCAFCKGVLLGWVQGDSALGEHARHFPECTFVADINNKTTSLLASPKARVLLNMGYSATNVKQALIQLYQAGIKEPTNGQLVDALFDKDEGDSKDGTGAVMRSSPPPSTPIDPKITKLKEENEKMKQSSTCRVCTAAPVETLLLPCRHLVMCAKCATNVNFCPACSAKVIGTVRTYMS